MKSITEIVNFKTVEGVEPEVFLGIVDGVEKNFHMLQEGFINTELVQGDEVNSWCMVQHWQTAEHAHAASRAMFKTAVTERFRMALDPKTVKMAYYKQVGCWSK